MKFSAVLSFLSVIFFSSFCAGASQSFAEEDNSIMMLGESYRIENVIFCENKNTALLLAQKEVAFLKAKKSLKAFYDEIMTDVSTSECGTIKSIFMLSKIIHSYIGYNSNDTMEPIAWCIVEVISDVAGLEKKLYLFIPSQFIR